MVKRNKKILNQKIKEFVLFNKYESFTRQTLMHGFKLGEVDWMRFSAKDSKSRYFQRENEFVLWRFLRWLLEDYVVTLLRCYFYITEKQKEYSRVYFYRKNIWNVVMKLSIQDLEEQKTLMRVEKKEMKE